MCVWAKAELLGQKIKDTHHCAIQIFCSAAAHCKSKETRILQTIILQRISTYFRIWLVVAQLFVLD